MVGVDSDRAIRLYKKTGLRPIVPQDERCEMLSYQSCVDYVIVVDDVTEEGAWEFKLLDVTNPDVFIAVHDSYPKEQLREIEKRCGTVTVLPRQAENTSTSKLIERALKGHLEEMLAELTVRRK